MNQTYRALAEFAQTWGLVYLVVLTYALSPSRQRQFDEDARIPLRED
jgi:cytochrome c oxidase cbb3-type subunit 4